jgi:PTH2 family peptidyl-tRNA hydrolase
VNKIDYRYLNLKAIEAAEAAIKKETSMSSNVKSESSDEIVQYFVANKELNMSTGKVAAQVSHVATKIAVDASGIEDYLEVKREGRASDPYYIDQCKINDKFEIWREHDHPVIILGGTEKDLLKLIDKGAYFVRDNGRTEVPPNSLTVVGFAPEYKSVMKPVVGRLRLL